MLDRELGSWLHTCTNLKAEWTPSQTQSTVTGSYARILGGGFVQGQCKTSDGQTYLLLDTYDAQRKCYRRWLFYSNGQTSELVGRVSPDAKTLTWSYSVDAKLTYTQIDRYIDADTIEFSAMIKDLDGKVYYQSETWSSAATFLNGRYTQPQVGFVFPTFNVFGLFYAGVNAQFVVVPEPSPLALLGPAGALMAYRTKHRPDR